MRTNLYLWMVLLFLKSALLSAQSCDSTGVCGCITSDLSPAGGLLGHEHEKGTWRFSYRYMNMMMKGNISGTAKAADNSVFNNYIMLPQNMNMDMHMLMAMYGISDKLSVMLMFNYNVLSMNMTMLPGTMVMNGSTMSIIDQNSDKMNTKTSGLGDTKLYAVYALLNHDVHHLFLSAGINIPSGSISMKGAADNIMYPAQPLPYNMQMGSGSVDFMPGLTYLLKKDEVSFSTQVTSVIRPFYNSLNYHLGNEFNLNCWGAYKFFPWMSGSLRLEGNYSEAISGNNIQLQSVMEPAATPFNYGGQSIYSYIGLNFYLNSGGLNNSKLSVEYGIPLYQNVNGIQLASANTLYAGWLISF